MAPAVSACGLRRARGGDGALAASASANVRIDASTVRVA